MNKFLFVHSRLCQTDFIHSFIHIIKMSACEIVAPGQRPQWETRSETNQGFLCNINIFLLPVFTKQLCLLWIGVKRGMWRWERQLCRWRNCIFRCGHTFCHTEFTFTNIRLPFTFILCKWRGEWISGGSANSHLCYTWTLTGGVTGLTSSKEVCVVDLYTVIKNNILSVTSAIGFWKAAVKLWLWWLWRHHFGSPDYAGSWLIHKWAKTLSVGRADVGWRKPGSWKPPPVMAPTCHWKRPYP